MINRLIKNEKDYSTALTRIEQLMDANRVQAKWMNWNFLQRLWKCMKKNIIQLNGLILLRL